LKIGSFNPKKPLLDAVIAAFLVWFHKGDVYYSFPWRDVAGWITFLLYISSGCGSQCWCSSGDFEFAPADYNV